MKRALLLPVLLIFFLSSGCRTYFGYEATITEEDIKNSSQLVSSKFKEYQLELDGSQIKAWEKYEDTYQKSVAVIEHRKHAKRYSPYLNAFHESVKSRRGGAKANIALARKFLDIVYKTLKNNWMFEDFSQFKLVKN